MITQRYYWLPTILALLITPILLGLGFWQLERGAEKRRLLADYTERHTFQSLTWSDLSENWSDYRYYPVELTGQLDNAHTILLDNKIVQGQVGYHVLTPLLALDQQTAVLVNRGWIPQGASRQQLPNLPVINEKVTIQGVINDDSGKPYTLAAHSYDAVSWPLLIQYIDLDELQVALDYTLLPMVILQDSDSANGFVRDWQITTMPPEKHVAYAVQWFGLAATLVILTIILTLRIRKDR